MPGFGQRGRIWSDFTRSGQVRLAQFLAQCLHSLAQSCDASGHPVWRRTSPLAVVLQEAQASCPALEGIRSDEPLWLLERGSCWRRTLPPQNGKGLSDHHDRRTLAYRQKLQECGHLAHVKARTPNAPATAPGDGRIMRAKRARSWPTWSRDVQEARRQPRRQHSGNGDLATVSAA